MIIISFRYLICRKYGNKENFITLDDLNRGLTACRHLGYWPVEIHVSQKEWNEMSAWTYIGQKDEDKLENSKLIFGLKIKSVLRNPNVIEFICEPWDGKV